MKIDAISEGCNSASVMNDTARPMIMALLGVRSACPKCGGEFSERVAASFRAGNRVKCNGCDFYGNWRYGTKLEGSRISNIQFLSLFFKYTLPNDAPAIAKVVGLDPGTVRSWRDYFVSQAVAE